MTLPRISDRTLYVSDLDFSLLRSDATLSSRTVDVVNRLIADGGLFTYATARSFTSAIRVTSGLDLSLPLITYGGAVLVGPSDRTILAVTPLPTETVAAITSTNGPVQPIVFAMVDGRDRLCWRDDHVNRFVRSFLSARADDPRLLPVPDWSSLAGATIFAATLIGERHHIDDVREVFLPSLGGCFTTVGPDGYHPDETWFEIVASNATKAAAAARLAAELRATSITAFGDNRNDVPLFEVADHSCAVANAVPELRAIAREIIGSNDDDGVAEWLARNVLGEPG